MPQYDVLDGPSRWDLMLALFDPWLAQTESRKVRFTISRLYGSYPTDFCEATVVGVRRIAGNEAWEITGEARPGRSGVWVPFRAQYSTARRRGSMTLES